MAVCRKQSSNTGVFAQPPSCHAGHEGGHLKYRIMLSNQEITFLSDGDDTLRELQLEMSPMATHLLDWFHLTMRLTVLSQLSKGLVHCEAVLGEEIGNKIELSLSRLNHWLPGCEAHPEVMQRTADFHYEIADALLPQTDPVFDDATTFHTAVDMLNPQPTAVQRLVGHVLLQRQFLAAGFLDGHEDLHLGQRERQEAQIL